MYVFTLSRFDIRCYLFFTFLLSMEPRESIWKRLNNFTKVTQFKEIVFTVIITALMYCLSPCASNWQLDRASFAFNFLVKIIICDLFSSGSLPCLLNLIVQIIKLDRKAECPTVVIHSQKIKTKTYEEKPFKEHFSCSCDLINVVIKKAVVSG